MLLAQALLGSSAESVSDIEALARWLTGRGIARLTDETVPQLPSVVAELLDLVEAHEASPEPPDAEPAARTTYPDAAYAQAVERKETARTIWRLVSALEATYRIQRNDGLVTVLGDGTERDNREALFTWVRNELETLQAEAAIHHLPKLTDRLGRWLQEWELERV